MITVSKMDEAIKESKRFIAISMAAKGRFQNDPLAKYGCKETGAVRRASMDLSQALVRLRDHNN